MSQFIGHVKEIRANWDDPKDDYATGLWFRGAQKSNWPLTPGLYRFPEDVKELLEAEDEIREEFVKRAPSLTEHRPLNAWEWYFLMQHYGTSTRLLDWTESPHAGLYFAVKDGEGLHDAVVWVLDPWWLNYRVLRKREVIPPGSPGLSSTDEKTYRRWLPDRFDAKQRLTARGESQ
jgi:FRG domain